MQHALTRARAISNSGMCQVPLLDDEACMLVESDLEGMVGLPATTLQVGMRPLHHPDRVYEVGDSVGCYCRTRLSASSMTFFKEAEQNPQRAHAQSVHARVVPLLFLSARMP